MFISLIIPVYNRPHETEELLASLSVQTRRDFEVVVVEDGSATDLSSESVVARYCRNLDITYIFQENGGPASARNTGAANARGDFFVIMDSDCIVPSSYFETVYREIAVRGIEFYGGPDTAAPDFSPLQKAVSYSMTSPFTTGGIRGSKRMVGKFSPRSFNLGISRRLFQEVGGFSDMRIGEDIDFSMRVMASGAKAWFLPEAKVCHKRRTSMKQFFKQVFIFGTARVNLNIRHPESRKIVYLLPTIFTVGSFLLFAAAALWDWWFLPAAVAAILLWISLPMGTAGGLLLYFVSLLYSPGWFYIPFSVLMLIWFTDSSVRNKSVRIGWLSIWTSFIQLYGYGLGFLYGFYMRRMMHRDEPYTYKVTKFFSPKRK